MRDVCQRVGGSPVTERGSKPTAPICASSSDRVVTSGTTTALATGDSLTGPDAPGGLRNEGALRVAAEPGCAAGCGVSGNAARPSR